jgi:GNAT superfamily N-acetyltransferase
MRNHPRWIIRDGSEEDSEQILSLRELVFGEFEKEKLNDQFWKWEFVEGPDGKAYIYVAVDEGNVVGHLADIPRRFSVNGHVVLGTFSVDLMVHPDYRREGMFLKLMHYATERVEREKGHFRTALPFREETIAGLLKCGWEIAGELPVLVYPLRFSGIIHRYLHFSPLSLLIGGVARGGYFLFWGGKRKEKAQGIQLEEVTQLDSRFDRFWQKAMNLYVVMGIRDQAFLDWRYFKNPVRTYTFYRAIENGEMTGYLVLRKVDLLRFNSAVIVDLLALSDQALRALIEKGIQQGQREGADLIGCMIPQRHPYYQVLRESGFLPSPKKFLLMVYRQGKGMVSLAPETWYMNCGDTDVI